MNTEITLKEQVRICWGMYPVEYENFKYENFFEYVQFLADERGLKYADLMEYPPVRSIFYTQWNMIERLYFQEHYDLLELYSSDTQKYGRDVEAEIYLLCLFKKEYVPKIKNYFPASLVMKNAIKNS